MEIGYELRGTSEKGEGIYATQPYKVGDTVMIGVIKEVLTCNHSHASQIDEHTHVLHAVLISKVNHCCEPNCGIHLNETGAHDFVAMKDIGLDEEVTFDYAMRNYSIDHFPKNCMCGTHNCRGRITGWKDLSGEKKKAYEGFVAPYLLALDSNRILAGVLQVAIPHGNKGADVLQTSSYAKTVAI